MINSEYRAECNDCHRTTPEMWEPGYPTIELARSHAKGEWWACLRINLNAPEAPVEWDLWDYCAHCYSWRLEENPHLQTVNLNPLPPREDTE